MRERVAMSSGAREGELALERADAALAHFDIDGAVAHLSAAVRALTAAGDRRRGAMACVRLGDALANGLGNLTAGRAWYARARRLVEDEPPCLEQGWVAVAAMGCEVDDPAELLAAAELALDRARRFGDVNLETKALADAGLAHVQAGRLAEGMALLDEAMALACGPAEDTDCAAKSVCSFFSACYYAADFERAGAWTELLRQRGLIALAPGTAVFLSSHCDSVQATSLIELGRWSEAETVLTRAQAEFETLMRSASWHPDIALADLRIRQGRLADAEALLLGKDQALQALLPAARLHLARGDLELARATARRGLRLIAGDRLRAVELLAVLVDAELASGALEAAGDACAELGERAGTLAIPSLQARGGVARARLQAATGDLAGAIATLEAAADGIDARRLPWLAATLLVELARRRDEAGDRTAATVDARAASAILATLDVVPPPADAELLRRLGAAPPAGASVAVLAPDGRWWVAAYGGTSVRLAETKGLRYLAELVAAPGMERHVLDLVDRVEGIAPAGGLDRRALGDAGPALDGAARTAYRHRIEELRADIDDALATGRLDEAEARRAELDQLVQELARAFGLGGRDRTAASAAERARLNVTRALRSALVKLAEAVPGAGAALDRRIRTGLYCAYEPSDDDVRWIVQSAVNEDATR
jgi:tetratricopeptide (TPR) repeat protein